MPSQGHQPERLCLPGRKLLVLQNPGRGSRNYLDGILSALRDLSISYCVLELHEVWAINKTDPRGLVTRLSQILIEQRIGAVLGYGFNGMGDIPPDGGPMGTLRSFFEVRNIPHLMLWIDHPQWHADLVGLSPQLQGMFRSGNSFHFLKSAGHALELERMLGWPNCFELPPGVDPAHFPVCQSPSGRAQYDLVAIVTDGGTLPDWLKGFVDLDDPDPRAIRRHILKQVKGDLAKLWSDEIPDNMRDQVTALGDAWADLKAELPFQAATRHWPAMLERFPGAAWFLTMDYPMYMKAQRILWRLREWERRFYLAYLARFFRVGVFGGDWSQMGLGPGGWVNFLSQSEIYARGRVALNITDGHDEEGLTIKSFEIAASGVPMMHYHADGLEGCFDVGAEVARFSTPREARDVLDRLLDDSTLRQSMADNARARVLRDHTWARRVTEMFRLARLPMGCFREARSKERAQSAALAPLHA